MKARYVLSLMDYDDEYTEYLYSTYEEAKADEERFQADGLETFGIEKL